MGVKMALSIQSPEKPAILTNSTPLLYPSFNGGLQEDMAAPLLCVPAVQVQAGAD